MKRTRWGRWVLVGVGLVVILGLTLGVWWVGQTAAPTARPADSPPPSPVPGSVGVVAALPSGGVVAGEGGSRPGPGGVPIGYPQTAQGAAAAATNYLGFLYSPRVAIDADRDRVASELATGELADMWRLMLDQMVRGELLHPGQKVYQPERGAYAVDEFTGTRARILVWYALLRAGDWGPGSVPDDSTWLAQYVELVWDGDWRIADPGVFEIALTGKPADTKSNPSALEKARILRVKDAWAVSAGGGYKTPPRPEDRPWIDWWDADWQEYRNAAR